MKHPLLSLAFFVLPLIASAQVIYVNETFDTDTVGSAPTDSAQRFSAQVLVQNGTGAMGTDRLAHFNDVNSSAGALEYNVGESALGALYVSFDLFNNNPSGTGAGTNPIIFGVGAWNSANSLVLNANNKRHFGLEFSANGTTQTFKIRIDGTAVYTSVYSPSEVQSVQVWVNDHDSNSLNYIRPDNYQTATLSANSVVVFINGVLQGASASGYGTNSGLDLNVGNATMGRVGFNTSTTVVADFSIDNVYIASAAPIPEPSTYAAVIGLAALGFVAFRRRGRRLAART